MDPFEKILRAAAVDSTVLILAPSAVVRWLIAKMLHHHGPRQNGPFVTINCATIPAQLVESELFGLTRGTFTGYVGGVRQADGGTLYIDEVDRLSPDMQDKLLRFLESSRVTPVGGREAGQINVRVVSATSNRIDSVVQDGRFNEALYYRLNVVTIDLRDG